MEGPAISLNIPDSCHLYCYVNIKILILDVSCEVQLRLIELQQPVSPFENPTEKKEDIPVPFFSVSFCVLLEKEQKGCHILYQTINNHKIC